MLRFLLIGILASIFIIQIQADKRLGDVINSQLTKLTEGNSETLEDRLSVLNDKQNVLKLWMYYKEYSKKAYPTPEEDRQRMKTYVDNLKKIMTANYNFEKGLQTYDLEMNEFGDMDVKEFISKYTGIPNNLTPINSEEKDKPIDDDREKPIDDGKVKPINNGKIKPINDDKDDSLSRDYRKKRSLDDFPAALSYRSYYHPAENQGLCGSCYAFAAAGTVEGAYAVKKRRRIILSKQDIVDCGLTGGRGCHGGQCPVVFDYIKQHGGLALESSYKYYAAERTCAARTAKYGKIRGHGKVTSMDDDDMIAHLNFYGPLAVYLNASQLQFFTPNDKSILDYAYCSKTINHAVIIVGYGTSDGIDYWLVRNSWGTGWADQGYFKIVRNKNMCGISQFVHYVLL